MDSSNGFEAVSTLADKYFTQFMEYMPKIVGALVIYLVGLWLIKVLVKYLRKGLDKREYEETLKQFFVNIVDVALRVILTVAVIAQLGIQTTSIVAVFGAAGLAVGMALQGSLSNFAGGVILIILRPFQIGDWVEAGGTSGTVKEVSIFYTKLINVNGLLVVVPNGQLSNNKITNYTVEGKRTDFIKIRVAYGTDIQKAREALVKLMKGLEGVYETPAPRVVVDELAHDFVSLSVQFTSDVSDFWGIHYQVLEQAEVALKEVGVGMSNPRYDIHLLNNEE